MDILFIEKLSVITNIGIYNWEQCFKQKLIVDIKLGLDSSIAGKSDNIKDCLNYDEISMKIINYVENKKFKLIESVAEEISQIILNNFNTSWVKVKVSKPNAVLYASNVGVIIERNKNKFKKI